MSSMAQWKNVVESTVSGINARRSTHTPREMVAEFVNNLATTAFSSGVNIRFNPQSGANWKHLSSTKFLSAE